MAYTIVLGYSGGLDTSIIVPWLREKYEAEIICVAADVGQGEELSGLEARAQAQGAQTCIVQDLRETFVREVIWPTLRSGAVYARKYSDVIRLFTDPSSGVFHKAFLKVKFYRLRPENIFYIDNSQGFGQRLELTLNQHDP